MVLVDTSIWIALFRKQHADVGQKLWMLAAANDAAVTGQIWVEFLGGFRKSELRRNYQDLMSAYPFIETSRAAYDLAVELAGAHPRLGAGDAIIAATAITAGAPLWTLDDDFGPLRGAGLDLFD